MGFLNKKKITYKKEDKDQNFNNDNVCYIPINEKSELLIRATFAFHVFVERLFNEACDFNKGENKPLLYFIDRACENNFIFPVQNLSIVLSRITKEWFGINDEAIEIKNINEISMRFLYLLALCHGGGKFAKKLLALRSQYQISHQEEKTDLVMKEKALIYINGNSLH